MGVAADIGAIAAPYFAVHNRRLQCLLSPMIRGGDGRVHEEEKPRSGMVVEVLGETVVGFILPRPFRQVAQTLNKILVSLAASIGVGVFFVEAIAQAQRFGEQANHLLRKDFGRADLLVYEPARTPQRMVDALLMDGVLETFVGRITIVSHAARPVDADDFFQNIGTALRVDGVEGCSIITDPPVEPGGSASDTPTGFIGSQMFGIDDSLFDLLVNRLEDLARPHDDLSTGAAGERDAKELIESVGDLSVRHAGTLVEVNDGCLGVGAELALGGASGFTGLQRMSAAQMLAAVLAMAAVDFEFTDDGLTANFGLKLLIEMVLDDGTTAVRALLRQRRFESFIDTFGRRRFAMSVLAVLIA